MPGSLLVTLLFWCLVFPYWPDAAKIPVVYLIHGVNFAVMVGDAVVAPMPFRLRHAVLIVAYGITYVSFSFFWWLGGGTNEWGALFSALRPALRRRPSETDSLSEE